jgi:large subunit ribosomal protein L4
MVSANLIDFQKEKKEKISLPATIFGVKPNLKLIAHAVRVYLANQRKSLAKTKTRGEVKRTKAKIYRQKGTGRARHGSRSAPIFVGGGRAHGPRGEQNYKLLLPKKMRMKALISALSAKTKEGKIVIVEGIEKFKKTKEAASALEKFFPKEKNFLLVIPKKNGSLIQAFGNLPFLEISCVDSLNIYRILKANKILLTKEVIKSLEDKWKKS